MKMIYVGSIGTQPDRDSGWISAFEKYGWEVITFCSQVAIAGSKLLGQVQRRFNCGPLNKQMQKSLIELSNRIRPDWIHFRLPIEYNRSTILALKTCGALVTQYFNDDPFSKQSPFGLYWKFKHALTAYDVHFVYRQKNVEEYRKCGAKYVFYCPPTYDPRRHKLQVQDISNFMADAAFIGHYEEDWRLDCIEALYKDGFTIVLKGGGELWNQPLIDRSLESLTPVTHAYGKEYNRIYASVCAGLCFFSKVNNDKWTERALEIVAVGGVLVCERTDESQSYFKDRVEAFFFSSVEELLTIVRTLKSNPWLREKVRMAGYQRLLDSNNSIFDRAREVVEYIQPYFKRLENTVSTTLCHVV